MAFLVSFDLHTAPIFVAEWLPSSRGAAPQPLYKTRHEFRGAKGLEPCTDLKPDGDSYRAAAFLSEIDKSGRLKATYNIYTVFQEITTDVREDRQRVSLRTNPSEFRTERHVICRIGEFESTADAEAFVSLWDSLVMQEKLSATEDS